MRNALDPAVQGVLDVVRIVPWNSPCVGARGKATESRTDGRLAKVRFAVGDTQRTIRKVRSLIRIAKKEEPDIVVIFWVEGKHVVWLKIVSLLRNLRIPHLLIGHNYAEKSRSLASRLVWPSLLDSTNVPSPFPYRFIALHGGISAWLETKVSQRILDKVSTVEYPAVWGESRRGPHRNAAKVKVALLSPSHKGVSSFCEFVVGFRKECGDLAERVSFSVVGGYSRYRYEVVRKELLEAGISEFPTRYGTGEEYGSEIDGIHYAAMMHARGTYEARFSSTMYDAICWGTPGIYTSSQQLNEISKAGHWIGWGVDSPREGIAVLAEQVANFSWARYEVQCERVKKCRDYFSVERSGRQLARAVVRVGVG